MPTNRYASSCARCGEHVPAGQGDLRLEGKGWKVYCITIPLCQPRPAAPRIPAPQAKVGDLSGIMALFDMARTHLKTPAIVISVPAVAGFAVRLNVAGSKAREPGSLTVLTDEKDPVTGKRAHLGSISKSGHWRVKSGLHNDAVVRRLQEFAARPADIATEHGKLTGRCCFCRNKLTREESTGVGYGRICGDHFGLPWGAKPVEFAGEAVQRDLRTENGIQCPECSGVQTSARPEGGFECRECGCWWSAKMTTRRSRSANRDQDNLRALWANIPGEA